MSPPLIINGCLTLNGVIAHSGILNVFTFAAKFLKMKILVTGTAGFIGFHLANRLLKDGHEVVGLDSINDYYDVNLKYDRLQFAGISRDDVAYNTLAQSSKHKGYRFIQLQLEDRENILELFKNEQFDAVVNPLRRQACGTALPIHMYM